MKYLLALCLLALLPGSSHADTFVVDSQLGAGADFAQVQGALDSPLVNNGDELLVRPGFYAPIMTRKSVTLRGLGAIPGEVFFFSGPEVNSVFTGCKELLRVSNVKFQGLLLENCSGPVLILDVEMASLILDGVKKARIENKGSMPTNSYGVEVRNESRADFVLCNLRGKTGPVGGTGSNGAWIQERSQVRFADCNIAGGFGGDAAAHPADAGDGGVALLVSGGSTVQLIGRQGNAIRGGHGGWGLFIPNDGMGAAAIEVEAGSKVRVSNYNLFGGQDPEGLTTAPVYVGAASDLVIPDLHDPLLATSGSFLPGGLSLFSLLGDPNSAVVLFVGTQVKALPLAGVIGSLATDFAVPVGVGNTNGAGEYDSIWIMPHHVPLGTLAYVQAGMAYGSDGSSRLSNPVTLLVE